METNIAHCLPKGNKGWGGAGLDLDYLSSVHREPLMSISSLRPLDLSALSLEVWAKAAGVIITQGSRLCWGAGCAKAWEQQGQAAADAVPPSARKGSNAKQMYLSLPTALLSGQGILPQGGVSACSGNSGRRPTEISHFTKVPAAPQGPAGPAAGSGKPGLAAGPRDTGSRPFRHRPANPTTVGWTLRFSEPSPLGN